MSTQLSSTLGVIIEASFPIYVLSLCLFPAATSPSLTRRMVLSPVSGLKDSVRLLSSRFDEWSEGAMSGKEVTGVNSIVDFMFLRRRKKDCGFKSHEQSVGTRILSSIPQRG